MINVNIHYILYYIIGHTVKYINVNLLFLRIIKGGMDAALEDDIRKGNKLVLEYWRSIILEFFSRDQKIN